MAKQLNFKSVRPKSKVTVVYWRIARGRDKGQWRWSARARNNRKICTPGESFTTETAMWHNVNLIFNQLDYVPYKRIDDPHA